VILEIQIIVVVKLLTT